MESKLSGAAVIWYVNYELSLASYTEHLLVSSMEMTSLYGFKVIEAGLIRGYVVGTPGII